MSHSSIEWTEQTWNPVTGCTKISPGCKFCYAQRLAGRLKAMGVKNYANDFKLTLHPHMLDKPLTWKKPSMIFVNSMSDLFHVKVPDDFVMSVFNKMNEARWHNFQVLTKRPERVLTISKKLKWSKNIWMGTSVENEKYTERINILRKVPAKIRFLSLEPLLGPLPKLNLKKIDWVIVGGESGPKARPMEADWAREIRDQCKHAGVAFFFKQWGGKNKKREGRKLDKRTWDEMPKKATLPNRQWNSRERTGRQQAAVA